MKKWKLGLLAVSALALTGCLETEISTYESMEPEHDVTWVSPTGIPTLAFYDQGDNANWTSYAATTDVAVAFASDAAVITRIRSGGTSPASRSTDCLISDLPPKTVRNCFGRSGVESGQNRSPLPPDRITA